MKSKTPASYEFLIVLVLVNALGFPGNLIEVYGEKIGTIIDYSCFFIVLFLLVGTTASQVNELVLIRFRTDYCILYLFVLYVIVDSMLMTPDFMEELVTVIRLSVTVLFSLWLCDRYKAEQLVTFICIAQMVFVVATIIFMLVYPRYTVRNYSGEIDFIGLIDSKNGCATELALGLAMFAVRYRFCKQAGRRFGRTYTVFTLLQILLILRCKSIGAVFVSSLPLIYILVLEPKVLSLKRLPLGWMFTLVSILFLIFAMTVLPVFEPLFKMVGKDATLTGRIPLWNRAITVMLESNPLTGFGYCMFWRNEDAVAMIQGYFGKNTYLGTMTSGTHNFLIETWTSLGLIGVAFLIFIILYSMRGTAEMKRENYLFCSAFFLIFTIKGLTERMWASAYRYDVLLFFLVLAIGCSDKGRQERRNWKRLHLQNGIPDRNGGKV